MRKQYPALDIGKFIAAWLIIILHTAPFGSYSSALSFGLRNIVTIVAVPFFFAVSGYLFVEKYEGLEGEERAKYLKMYLLRLLFMYLFWSAVYFVFVVIQWIRQGFTFGLVLQYIKDFIFEGSYSTIWYLPALLVAVLLVALLRKVLSYKMIFVIACAVHVFMLGGTSYWGLTQNVPVIGDIYNAYYSFFDSMKNGVLFGFIYVAMGGLIFECKEKLQISTVKNVVWIGVAWVLVAVEAFALAHLNWNGKGCDTIVTLVPLTFLVVMFCVRITLPEKEGYSVLRKYSTLLFLTQRIPISIIELFLGATILSTNSLLFFLSVSIVTLLISTCIWKFLEKRLPILKKFY